MRVRVRLFAILRERSGVSETTLDLPDGATAAGAAEALVRMYPSLSEPLKRSAYAVNHAYCAASELLRDGDELALIPPVSGGAPEAASVGAIA